MICDRLISIRFVCFCVSRFFAFELQSSRDFLISFIMPQIIYCHTVWHFCRASDSRKMEPVQERALRDVYCDTKSSYDELLRKAKLTTLGCRRLQDIAIIMYKAKYNICPPYIKDIFKLDKPPYGLRNSGDFFIPRYNTTTYGRHT